MDLNHARLPIPPRWLVDLQQPHFAAETGRPTVLFYRRAIICQTQRPVRFGVLEPSDARPLAIESQTPGSEVVVRRIFAVLLWIVSAIAAATAQLPLRQDDIDKVTPSFDSSEPDSLRCTIDEWKPSLDFALRFVTGYAVRCPVGEFEGEKARLLIYLRVTPAGKSPALFGSAFHLPEISPEMRQAAGKDVRKLKNEVGMSGVLCVGEGEYSIEVLVVDDKNRRCRRRWKARIVPKRDQRDVRLAIDPLTVEPIDRSSWKLSPPSERGGLHLTIFIDAAPIYPHQPVLRAWDRAFLLECVYSVLRQTPYKSIRVVAFNLEQQREIFRDEHFDAKAFLSLSHALREIETASVSVQALKQRNSPEFLATLANKELNAPDRSDAVIFLGPHARMDVKVSDGLLAPRKPESPPFFYFEYFPFIGGDFPDAIQRLVKSADGKTFAIHSPAQFDQAIQKMLAQLKQE